MLWKDREKAWLSMVLELKYKLRRFKPSDLDGVIRINRECLPENYSTLFFMNLHKRYPEAFIVAEVDRTGRRIKTYAELIALYQS